MEIMYYVMDAHSFYNFIYFILLIIVSPVNTHTHTHITEANTPLLSMHKCVCVGRSWIYLFSRFITFNY